MKAPTIFDSFGSIPEYEKLRTSLDAADWADLDSQLALLPSDQAAFALAALAEVAGVEVPLVAAVAELPHSANLRVALAMRYISIGWAIRSRADAGEVSPAALSSFREWLKKAEELLIGVCATHPGFAPAWSARVLTARGLELGESEARRRYRRLAELSPHDYPAQAHLLQFLLPKWFGSEEDAGSFARTAAGEAPQGSNSGALVALFHIEHWLALGGEKPGQAYLMREDVHHEIKTAAANSVLHASDQLDAIGVQAHSAFAMVLWLGGHGSEAVKHLRILDGRVSEFPWRYVIAETSALDPIYRECLDLAVSL